MEQPNIDYKAIFSKISEKCNMLLQNVDVNRVSDSFDAVKEIVEIAIEKYSFCVSEYWMANYSDSETSRKIKFTDVNNGYEMLIKKWVEQNPFKAELPEYPTNLAESYEEYTAKLNKKAIAIGAAGTIAIGTAYGVSASHIASHTAISTAQVVGSATCAKGWLIFGNPIVAIATELIGIAAIYAVVQYKKKNKRHEIDTLEEKLKSYKQNLITSLTVSAESYLKNAVAYSNSILTSF